MKTIHDLRHASLESLVSAAKSQREFADRVDLAPAYVSQMLLKRRGIGERTARKIETAMRLPRGWMDQDHEPATIEATAKVQMPDESAQRRALDLLPSASPRSATALSSIAKAAEEGRLTEVDLELLNQIAERLARKE